MGSTVPFGKAFRERYFTGFGEDVVNLNHGAYGATTPELLDSKMEVIKGLMKFPDEFYRHDLYKESKVARQAVADLVNCDVDDLVLVNNATTAVNAVLRSFPFEKGDVIICYSVLYNSCWHTLQYLQRRLGVVIKKIDIVYPVSNREIISKFEAVAAEVKRQGPKHVFGFFDGISSTPSALFPWQPLVRLCKSLGIISFVDAAHYVGLLPIDLSQDKPDFFCSNLHKWLFVPNSAAFLYVAPEFHGKINSFPISAVYNDSGSGTTPASLGDQFAYTSTLDYSSILTIPAALKFRKEICGGEDAIIKYNLDLAKQASQYIVANWPGSEILQGKEDDIVTAMFNIKIPGFANYTVEELTKVGVFLNDYLRVKKRTYIPVFLYDGALWTRWSTQIYLDLDDFKWGLQALKDGIEAYLGQ